MECRMLLLLLLTSHFTKRPPLFLLRFPPEFRGNPRAVKLFFSLYLVEMETCQTLMTLSE